MNVIDQDTLMGLIREHFGPDLQKAVTFARWKDGIDVDYPTYAIEAFAEAVAKVERERCAKLLEARGRQFNGGPERAVHILAAGTVRRGRLLTNEEQLANLKAALKDEPVPFPAPATAQ